MNINELTVEIEKLYLAFTGPPTAYFELPVKLPIAHHLERETIVRIVYQTVNVAMVGEAEQNEAALCDWLYSKLKEKLSEIEQEDRCVILIWRHKPSLEEFTNAEGKICTAIRARLHIPGKDLYDITCNKGSPPRYL